MPPNPPPPFNPVDHLLPRPQETVGDAAPSQKSSAGPVIGALVVVLLLVLGALYFWGAHLNQKNNPENNLPLIPGDTSVPIGG